MAEKKAAKKPRTRNLALIDKRIALLYDSVSAMDGLEMRALRAEIERVET
jgi:hypothetical protein